MRIVKGLLAVVVMATVLFASAPADTRLANAAMAGDRVLVASLLKQNVDVNGPMGDGSTALHWAASRGDLEMTQLLLKAGASVKAVTRIGAITPLFMAAKGGNPAVVQALLQAGASALESNANGTTVLMTAAAAGNPDAVKVLLDRGADVNATDKTNGQTALMFAASLNRAAAIKALLARSADPNIRTKVSPLARVQADENGNPLPAATQQGGRGQAEGRGARGGVDLGAQVIGGMAAMHFAAREGQMDAIRELVAGGADINLITGADKTPPMTEALINGHIDIAKYLLDHGANPNIANADGLTPLYATVDIRWRANAWYPQPNVAEEKTNYLDFMQQLIDRGADVNARLTKKLWFRKFRYGDDWVDSAGGTAFWRAAQANDLAAMRFLVSRGADPNLGTVRNVTPLMVAAGMGFEHQGTNIVPDSRMLVVKYMVEELGANVNAKDVQDYTTLHGTAYVGDNALILYLVSKGADVKARSKGPLARGGQATEGAAETHGDTVADMANGPREKSLLFPETVKLLESLGSENSNDCRSTACINKTKPDPKASPKPQ
jgi:uncharacterized protein